MQEIDAKELKARLDAGEKPLLLDVRESWEYDICHIDGSVLVPMNSIPAKLDDFGDDRDIVVICHHGNRSRHVAFYLEQNGFTKVINLAGGVAEWAAEVDPDMATY